MIQIKRKDLKDLNVLSFWYCEIYNICRYLKQKGYTCWLYGWNSDIYSISNSSYYISTGYRPDGTRAKNIDKWIKLEKNLTERKYKILQNGSYEKKQRFIEKKIYELVQDHIKILNWEK